MTKRFTIDEKMLGYLGEFVCDNGVQIRTLKEVVDLMNNLYDENNSIKHVIKEAVSNERTDLGRNVLKQLAESLNIK